MKTKQLPLLLLIIAIIPVFSFKPVTKAQDYRIAIGMGYVDKECNGITVQTAKAHHYRTSKGGSFSTMSDEIRFVMNAKFAIAGNDVNIATSTKQHGIIISYDKKISGYNCTKRMYTYGFGDDYEEAKRDAINRKNLDDKISDYGIVEIISVY